MKRKSSQNFSKIALAFLALSIPLGIFAISNISSFDTRNKAADLTLDIETCQIRFPYINPKSVEVNKTVQAVVSANTPGEAITSLAVMDRSGNLIVKKEYTTGIDKVSENFTLSPKETGDFGILGTLVTDKGTRPCVVEQNKEVVVVSSNTAPEFKTQPSSARPSNVIKVKESYQYQLEATDTESDNINYAFSFTPQADWLKPTVVENGTSGKLTLKFTGTPDKAGSYMANVFIHDGYNSHLRAQTWVINVDQDKNDIPKVSVIKPATEVSIKKGENITVSWEAADLNQITKYELYFATNPGNANSWIAINKNIGPKVGNYIVDTKDIPQGTYQFIVTATDNFNPPATGNGFSAKVNIGTPTNEGPDDGVVLQEAQVINISPSNESTIKNKGAIISATLVPGKEAKIKTDSVKIIFDDQDITSKSRLAEGKDGEYTILYTPEKEYSEGVHKVQVSFEDDAGNKASKSWTFTIVPDDSTNSDVFNIFGFQIPKRIAYIVAAGLAILLLALIVPWFLYLAWRGTKDDDDDHYTQVYKNTTKIVPPDSTEVTFVDNSKTEIKNDTPAELAPKKEYFAFKPLYSAPKEEVVAPTIQPVVENLVIEEKKTEPIRVEIPSPVVPLVTETIQLPEQDVLSPNPVDTTISVQTENLEMPNIVTPVEMTPPSDFQIQQTVTLPEETIIPTVQTPIVEQSTDSIIPPVIEEDQQTNEEESDILDSTNKQLEELAKKLRAKEEMLDEFMPTPVTPSDSAPSSTQPDPINQEPTL